MTKLVGKEVAGFETVLRDGARRVADEFGVDYRTARQILMTVWRDHRGQRSEAAISDASNAQMTETETEQDF